jgi:hypothetical protein
MNYSGNKDGQSGKQKKEVRKWCRQRQKILFLFTDELCIRDTDLVLKIDHPVLRK